MVFQSFHFLLFFVVALIAVRVVFRNSFGSSKTFLLVASYYFYMCWDWRFASLILAITAINFVAGPRIHAASDAATKKLWLAISLAASLGLLAYFKYANFFVDSFAGLLAAIGIQADIGLLHVVLPVGISFYTFQSISYVLDIYRGRVDPVASFRDFALFVAFFPQLVAGPIVRASHFLPQLKQGHRQEMDKPIESGIALTVRGFLKKIAIADVLGVHYVDPAFSNPENFSSVFLIVALYAYSYQVYMVGPEICHKPSETLAQSGFPGC